MGSVQHLRSRLCGLVAEPGGTPHHLVLGYPSAQLAFLDCRMLRCVATGGFGGGGDGGVQCACDPAAAGWLTGWLGLGGRVRRCQLATLVDLGLQEECM